MDSMNPSAGTTQAPSDRDLAAAAGKAPSDSTGISHPTTYETDPNNTSNIKPSASEPVSAAKLQAKTTTPDSNNPSGNAPSTSKKLDTETHAAAHGTIDKKDEAKAAADEDAEIDNKPRKDHETTKREIMATQEKAMAGTHAAEKEGEALRSQQEREDAKAAGSDGLEQHASAGSHHHDEGGHEHEKVGLKDKLIAKVHHH